ELRERSIGSPQVTVRGRVVIKAVFASNHAPAVPRAFRVVRFGRVERRDCPIGTSQKAMRRVAGVLIVSRDRTLADASGNSEDRTQRIEGRKSSFGIGRRQTPAEGCERYTESQLSDAQAGT